MFAKYEKVNKIQTKIFLYSTFIINTSLRQSIDDVLYMLTNWISIKLTFRFSHLKTSTLTLPERP